MELASMDDLEGKIRGVHALPGPLLANVMVDHGGRTSRRIEAVKGGYTRELLARQRTRFLARPGVRSLAIVSRHD